jgi:hypothetical protein
MEFANVGRREERGQRKGEVEKKGGSGEWEEGRNKETIKRYRDIDLHNRTDNGFTTFPFKRCKKKVSRRMRN